MKPHRFLIFFLLAVLLAALRVGAQQLRISSIRPGLEPMCKSMERLDKNGEICALVKYEFPERGLYFEGSTVGDQEFRKGEYWVYYVAGTKMVRVKGEGFYPTDVTDVRTFLGDGEVLQGNRVYIARIEVDGGAVEKKEVQTDFPALEAITGALNVDYTPTYATVAIDGREAGKSPRIFRDLPVGTHSVTISYPGFASRTHSVTISEDATAELKGSLEKVAAAAAPAASGVWRTVGRNLDLAVSRDGKNYFFSEGEWKAMSSSEKAAFKKLGIVIDNKGQRFMWSLTDDAVDINWHNAMSRFGSRLPSKAQAEALASQYKAVKKTIRAYGGDSNGSYWTKEAVISSLAWRVSMYSGTVSSYGKTYKSCVRVVAPVPETEAK